MSNYLILDILNITSGYSRHVLQKKHSLAPAFDNVCIASRFNQCTETKDEEWVQCIQCYSWYHCKCIGLARHHVEGKMAFTCCVTSPTGSNPV